MFFTIAKLTVFMTLLDVVLSLTCHVGMNMSVGGIPVGYYSGRIPCDTKGKTCMIEEITIGLTDAQYTHAKLTYGGCFSRDVQERLSCSRTATTYLNAKELLEIASVLDDAMVMYTMKMALDPNRITSYRGWLAQIHDSLLNFMESAGFERDKVRELLNMVLYHDISDSEFMKLLSTVGTVNEATKRLSSAMLDLTMRQSGDNTIPEKVSLITRAVTALMFPVLRNAKYDAEDMFSKMSNVFESSDANLTADDCLYLFPTLFVTEIVIASNTNQVSDQIYDPLFVPVHHISERCSSLYPGDDNIHRNHYVQKHLSTVLKDHAKCIDGRFKCRVKLENAIEDISRKSLELMPTASTTSLSPLLIASQKLISKMDPILKKAKSNPIALLGSFFKTYVAEGRELTLGFLHALSDSMKQLVECYGLYTSCEDYYCERDMCNSQIALREERIRKRHGKLEL